jgi:F0F1-type ATP synthase assembly protein I
MESNTRFFICIQQINCIFFRKIQFIQQKFSICFFCLFFGFLIGSLFGTFLNGIRGFISWDGFIISLVLVFCEIISYCLYSTNNFDQPRKNTPTFQNIRTLPIELNFFIFDLGLKKKAPFQKKYKQTPKNQARGTNGFFSSLVKTLNYFKLGLLFGFFIDAYKVGS